MDFECIIYGFCITMLSHPTFQKHAEEALGFYQVQVAMSI